MIAGISALTFVLLAAQGSPAGASRITGRVADAASGAPISGAQITLMMLEEFPNGAILGHPPRQSTTDAAGAFTFDGVEPGRYVVHAEKTGFASYPDELGGEDPEPLLVDGKTAVLKIALNKGAVITGRILNAAGEPQADLVVNALRHSDRVGWPAFVPGGQAQTNDLGEFRIAGLAAGDYIVVASSQPHDPFGAIPGDSSTAVAPTYFPGTVDQHAARVSSLMPGQVVDGLEFSMKTVAAFHVSGVVVDSAGHPSPHAMVMLVPDLQASGFLIPTMSLAADDGTFTIAGVIPGSYLITANVNTGGGGMGGFLYTSSQEVMIGSKSDRATVTVAAADVTSLKVVAQDK